MLIDLEPGSTTCNDEEVSDYSQRDEPTWEATVEFLDGEKNTRVTPTKKGRKARFARVEEEKYFQKKGTFDSQDKTDWTTTGSTACKQIKLSFKILTSGESAAV